MRRKKTEAEKQSDRNEKDIARYTRQQNSRRRKHILQHGKVLYPLLARWGLRIGQHPDPERLQPYCVFDAATNTYAGDLGWLFEDDGQFGLKEGREVVRHALETLGAKDVPGAQDRLGKLLGRQKTAERNLSDVVGVPKIAKQIEVCKKLWLSLNDSKLQIAIAVFTLKQMAEAELKRTLKYKEVVDLLKLEKTDKRIGQYCRVGEYFGAELLKPPVKFDQYLSAVRLNEKAMKPLPPPALAEKAGDPDALKQILKVDVKRKVTGATDLRVKLDEAETELKTLKRQIDPADYEDAMDAVLRAADKVLSLADDDEAARNDICHRLDEHLFAVKA